MATGTDDVAVKFGGDIGGLTGAIAGAADFIKGFSEGVVGELKSQLAGASTEATKMGEAANQAATATHHLAEEQEGLGSRLKEGVKHVHENVEGFNDLKSKISEVVEVYAAAFAVERLVEFAKAMGEAAEATAKMAMTLGITTQDVQGLQTLANVAGVSMDTLSGGILRLDRAFATARGGSKQMEAAFGALGISTTQNYTQTELMNAALAGLGKMADGPARNALAMRVFGSSIQDLIPLIAEANKVEAEAAEQAEKYSTKNADATSAGLALADSFSENKNAMMGFNEILTQALAPAFQSIVEDVNGFIKSMIDSYREGGIVKVILEVIAAVVRTVGVIFTEIGHTISAVWNVAGKDTSAAGEHFNLIAAIVQGVGAAFVGFGTVVQLVIQSAATAVMAFVAAVKGLADVVGNVVSGNWKGALAAGDAGWARVTATASAGVGRLKAIVADGQAQLDRLQATKIKPIEDEGRPPGTTDGDPTGNGPKGPKGPSIVSIWEEQLHAAEIASNDFFTDQTANELAFWQSKVALVAAGSKDWLAVQSKIYDLRKTLAHQDYDEQIANLNESIQAAQGNAEQQIEIERRKVALVVATYGAQSKQAADARRELQRMEQQHQNTLTDLQKKGIDDRAAIETAAAASGLEIQRSQAEIGETAINERLKAGEISAVTAAAQTAALNARLRDMARTEAEAEWQIALKAMQDKMALDGAFPDKVRADQAAIERATAEHYSRLATMDAKSAASTIKDQATVTDAVRDKWNGIVSPIGDAFGQMFTGLLNRTTTFRQGLIAIGDTIVSDAVGWAVKIAERWIVNEIVKTSATAAGTAARTGLVATETTATVVGEGVKTGATVASQGARTSVSFIGTILRIGHEILGATIGVATHAAATVAHIAMDAARAAAGAWAALAGIPYIGPFIAPVAAVAALAGVLALGKSIFSAEKGAANVPYDGAMFELHKEEMVLPAQFANPLRDALSGVGTSRGGLSPALSGMASGASGGGANVPIHYAPVYQINDTDVYKQMRKDPGELVRIIKSLHRNGDLSLTK